MSENVQIKVFSEQYYQFFLGLYYKTNIINVQTKYEDDINEALEVCAKEIDYKEICEMEYLVDFKGYSLKELNDYAISQQKKQI